MRIYSSYSSKNEQEFWKRYITIIALNRTLGKFLAIFLESNLDINQLFCIICLS